MWMSIPKSLGQNGSFSGVPSVYISVSLLHFDTVSARQLIHDTEQLAAAYSPITVATSQSSAFAAALVAASERSNIHTNHLVSYLRRVSENSLAIVTHAENQDRGLGRAFEELS